MASMRDTPVKKMEIINTLATYEEKGIPAIQDILYYSACIIWNFCVNGEAL
jgi:hypothetical protein